MQILLAATNRFSLILEAQAILLTVMSLSIVTPQAHQIRHLEYARFIATLHPTTTLLLELMRFIVTQLAETIPQLGVNTILLVFTLQCLIVQLTITEL